MNPRNRKPKRAIRCRWLLGVAAVALVFLVIPWAVPAALADTPGTFSATGSLATGRTYYTATLLPTGKVLVAGGFTHANTGSSLASAELYDPVTGTWADTGSLTNGRVYHTATLLPNGKVLVASGQNNSSGLASAELYDPATGTWASTGSMISARTNHTATLLPNGKVLVAGSASAELYDPLTGTWTATGAPISVIYHSASLLPTGKVLVVGGCTPTLCGLTSAELYDPATGTWTSTGSLATPRYVHRATLLPNGKVLVSGGAAAGYQASAELYDPTTGTWASTGSMSTARSWHIATLLPNGKVLVAGGHSGGDAIASAEPYCPEMPGTPETWSATGSMTYAHNQQRLIVLTYGPNAGKALIAGRSGNDFSAASAELYNPATGTWAITGTPNTTRQSYVATVLPNGKVLIAGGVPAPGGTLNTAELYDPTAGTWSYTGSMASARNGPAAVLLTSGPNAGKVMVVGGFDGSTSLASAELYNPATGAWTSTGSMTTGRHGHPATLLPNGQVLVAGGFNQALLSGVVTAELYDPATGTWSGTGSMTTARYFHAAVLLTSGPNAGKVLVAGGNGTAGPLTSAELYDPATGMWSSTGSMTTARADTQSFVTLLPNGKVLAAGGFNSSSVATTAAEVYDPVTGTWASTGSMTTARFQYGVTLLPTGQVLVAGGPLPSSGSPGPFNGTTSAELYSTAICEAEEAPKLIVIKHVVNDNGGTATAANFSMTVTGASPSPASFPGEEAPGTMVSLDAGAYSVSETGPSGYAMSASADCSGTIAAGETKTCTITNDDIAPQTTIFFLHGSGGTANPPTLSLDAVAPTATTAKYKDSSSVNFSGGNPWKDIGTWTAAPSLSSGGLNALSDLHVWLGLKNSDDQGTQFDLRAEVYKNGTLVAVVVGETRCITGVTRNPSLAKEVTVLFPTFPSVSFNGITDVLSLKLRTRIGTNADETKCSGPGGSHNNAVGLRSYFDAVSRDAEFDGMFTP